jgi:hypothetical protein
MVHKKSDKMQTTKERFLVLSVVMAGLLLLSTTIIYNDHREATAQNPIVQESPNVVTIQNTSISFPAPNSAVNKSMPHQIVVALPFTLLIIPTILFVRGLCLCDTYY